MKSWKPYFKPQDPDEKPFRDWEEIWARPTIEIAFEFFTSEHRWRHPFAVWPVKTLDAGWIWLKKFYVLQEGHPFGDWSTRATVLRKSSVSIKKRSSPFTMTTNDALFASLLQSTQIPGITGGYGRQRPGPHG